MIIVSKIGLAFSFIVALFSSGIRHRSLMERVVIYNVSYLDRMDECVCLGISKSYYLPTSLHNHYLAFLQGCLHAHVIRDSTY